MGFVVMIIIGVRAISLIYRNTRYTFPTVCVCARLGLVVMYIAAGVD